MIIAKAKRWGNSMGVIIPRDVIERLNIHEGDELNLDVEKKGNVLKELFGAGKFSKPTKELLKEVRKGLESKYW